MRRYSGLADVEDRLSRAEATGVYNRNEDPEQADIEILYYGALPDASMIVDVSISPLALEKSIPVLKWGLWRAYDQES